MNYKIYSNVMRMLFAMLLLVQSVFAIKIVVPDQYKDQVEEIKKAERKERERELQGDVKAAGEGSIAIASKEPSEQVPAVATDEFLVQSVVEASETASEFEGSLAADQGLVSGQIVDKESGEPLAGVAILVEGADIATVTAEDGRYSLGPVVAGQYTLSFIKSGYIEANVTDYNIAGGEVSVFPFALPARPVEMSDEVYELQDFSVTAEEANNLMLQLDLVMNSESVLSVMSSEDFSKFAASDIGDAIKRVSGVSVVGGKYAVIRGLGDRYVSTTLNGLPVASPDPDRQAVQLDLFPSGLFSSMEVTKTFTPDQSATSTGGINLIVKELPEEFYVNGSVGTGYHSVATGNDDFLTNGSASSDDQWVDGVEDRALADIAKGTLPSLPGANRINDLLAGIIGYPYVTQAEYDAIENELAEISAVVSGDNHVQRKSQGPDYSFKIDGGDRYELGEALSIGVIGSVNYSRKASMIDDGEYLRSSNSSVFGSSNALSSTNFADPNASISYRNLSYDESVVSRGLSWFVGAGANIGENNTIRVQRMQLRKSEDSNSLYTGDYFHKNSQNDPQLEQLAAMNMLYTERVLDSTQVVGEHSWYADLGIFDRLDLDWGASWETATQADSNFQATLRGDQDSGYDFYLNPEPSSAALPVIYKIWRDVVEDRNSLKYDLSFVSENRQGFNSVFKLGQLHVEGERGLFEEFVSFKPKTTTVDELSDLDDQLLVSSYSVAADIDMFTSSKGHYFMLDQELFDRVRIIAGGRYQEDSADVLVNGELKLRGAGTNNPLAGLDKEGGYEVDDWYPSINVIFDVTEGLQLRAAYSETLALPSPREVSPFATSAFGGSDVDVGNPILQPSNVKSLDLGFNFVSESGDSFGVTTFAKQIEGRIEKLNGLNIDNDNAIITYSETLDASLYSWYNNPSDATILGFEIEGRKNLSFLGDFFDHLSVGGNYSFIHGEVERFPIEVERKENVGVAVSETRPLTEQPESILNFDLTYDNPDYGLRVALIYYYISDTLKAVSLGDSYDIYGADYSTLDLTVSKTFLENYKVSVSAKNLTNSVRRAYYDVEGDEVDAGSYRAGMSFSLSVSAEF
ncbi:TonB-dependent receptor domain-containing protein [Coraliomargarita sp. W4R53]